MVLESTCHDCGVEPGQFHQPGCDVEQCPRCGGQIISCGCIYDYCGLNRETLEEEHPGIFKNGPTDEMYDKWDEYYLPSRLPWTGEWPGKAECREFGWYCKWTDHGWERCDKDDPEATEDLNRLYGGQAIWDGERKRFIVGERANSKTL